jgi:hypothetical protein
MVLLSSRAFERLGIVFGDGQEQPLFQPPLPCEFSGGTVSMISNLHIGLMRLGEQG